MAQVRNPRPDATPDTVQRSRTVVAAARRGLLSLVLLASAVCSVASAGVVHFRVGGDHYVLVSVSLNDRETALFAVDTASSITVVSPALAKRLGLVLHGRRLARTPTESRIAETRNVDALRLGVLCVRSLEVLVNPLEPLKDVDPRIEGVLGQDVLKQWNYLLDYRRGVLEVDPHGDLRDRLRGERVPLSWSGRRALVEGTLVSIQGSRPRHVLLALDSAATAVTLFESTSARDAPSILGRFLCFVRLYSIHGSQLATKNEIESITVGSVQLGRTMVTVAPRPQGWSGRREHGLLPTVLFESIYFDNHAAAAVLNPVLTRGPRRLDGVPAADVAAALQP